jgi:hypothetical protein
MSSQAYKAAQNFLLDRLTDPHPGGGAFPLAGARPFQLGARLVRCGAGRRSIAP